MQQHILIGIDHGTTNSCVAIMGSGGAKILHADPLNDRALTLPSYVHKSKESGTIVGSGARNAVLVKASGTGYGGYKRRLASDDRFDFPEVGEVLTAIDMGKTVLRALLAPCHAELGYLPLAAVVTIPAKFDQPLYDAMRAAAVGADGDIGAGLEQVVLLQEPIAASLAYCFQMTEDAKWIVFDLGGGTLDVSLVSYKDGKMEVPEKGNAGDGDLGGRLFDMKLMDYVIGPKKDEKQKWQFYKTLCKDLDYDYEPLRSAYALEDFSEGAHPSEWGRLMLAVEEAKIRLSDEEQTVVSLSVPLCKDTDGRDVGVEMQLSRSVFEKLIEADVNRAVNSCRMLLRNNHLKPDDIDFMLMVGGPSKTPYIQQILTTKLRIELRSDIDPMTVVGQGAAIHAATKELDPAIIEKLKAQLPPAAVDVSLSFPPSSMDEVVAVSGEIKSDEIEDFSDLTVQISRSDGAWEVKLPVDEGGWLEGDVLLVKGEKPVQSQFNTVIRDGRGNVLAELDDIRIWHPFPIGTEANLANSMVVALEGNATACLLSAGESLPAEGEQTLRTVNALRRGNAKDRLIIEVLEGISNLLGREDAHADCNMGIGQLIISGDQLESDVPAHSQVDITLCEDESRRVKVIAYIPSTDQEFEAIFDSKEFKPELEAMRVRLAEVKRGLAESRVLAKQSPNEDVDELYDMIAEERTIEEIEDGLVKIDEGSAQLLTEIYKKILCLAGTANCIYELQQSVRLKSRIRQLEDAGDAADIERLSRLGEAVDHAATNDDKQALSEIEDEIGKMAGSAFASTAGELGVHCNAVGYCAREKMAEYLQELVAAIPVFKKAQAHLDSLFAKAGWREGESRDLGLIRDMAKRGLLSEEDREKTDQHLASMKSIPKMSAMLVDYHQGQLVSGTASTEGGDGRPKK